LQDEAAAATLADMPRTADSPAQPAGPPTDRFEKRARRRGAALIAGVDEAGRGPLAGPVVTAAVVFHDRRFPKGLDDSKRVPLAERERLYSLILKRATVSVAIASRERIDRMNILRASLWAMSRAIAGLSCRPDHVLVDGNMLPPDLPCAAEAIVDGDALSVSIAAASIIAKVTRDRLMQRLGNAYPAYGFERHMGYSTPEHFAALRQHGPCPHHRQSFAPVREQQLLLEI
jgi:ribonuclease HII